jgi:signal transduction histidine kinase
MQRANALHGDVLARLKHELRTPIAAMRNSLALLDRFGESVPPERRQHWLKLGLGAANELDHLSMKLEEARGLAERAGQLRPRRVKVEEIQRGLQRKFAGRGAERLRFEVSLATPQLPALDPYLLRCALHELVANALTYSPAPAPVHVRLSCDDTHFTVAVTDQGCGIPADEAERIFAPYYRASNAREVGGSGLGLTLARYAAQLADGKVILASNDVSGTTFCLSFPVPVSEDH